MIAKLNLRTGLPKARAIYAELEPGRCTYTAPCVIGAMVAPEKRGLLEGANEEDTAIKRLIADGVVVVPKYQVADFVRLQMSFDRGPDGGFDEVFAELERKYARGAGTAIAQRRDP